MLAVAVTLSGLLGWAVAVVLIVGLRHTTAPAPVHVDDRASTIERAGAFAARGAGSLAGSITAGILVIGLGGRLMMRVLAATSLDESQGLITDMEAIVGTITVGGTIGFVVFVGMGAGIIGWLLRLASRRWLPKRSVTAGLVGAGLGAGLLARPSSLLEPDSRDFVILSPDWLAVVLIVGLIVTFGLLLAVLSDQGASRWPRPRTPRGAVWLAPLLVVLPLLPLAVGLGIVLVVRATAPSLATAAAATWADRYLPTVVVTLGAAGAAWTLIGAVEILLA